VNAPEMQTVNRLAVRSGLGPVRELAPLVGGANNRAYRVECQRGAAFLKAYFRSPADPRDRLGAEFAFARFAFTAGIRALPRPLACDAVARLGLFEFMEGERPTQATDALVTQAAEFVNFLNEERWRPAAATLPLASEACFSIEEHLGVVGGRANRLGDIEPGSDIDREAMRFVRRILLPVWEAVRNEARVHTRTAGISLSRPLDARSRWVSPSDFGFHNALVGIDGRAIFLDFEYAGWDDPAKLICDFFSQPAVPVPERCFDSFARTVAASSHDPAAVLARVQLLMPIYRLKWVCIRLNEFLADGGSRRRFSAGEDWEARKARQLAQARTALTGLVTQQRVSA
jgi:hypothetical protein